MSFSFIIYTFIYLSIYLSIYLFPSVHLYSFIYLDAHFPALKTFPTINQF